MGSVSKTNMGFRNTLITPRTIATIKVVVSESTATPGRIYAAINIATVWIKILKIIFIPYVNKY